MNKRLQSRSRARAGAVLPLVGRERSVSWSALIATDCYRRRSDNMDMADYHRGMTKPSPRADLRTLMTRFVLRLPLGR